MLQIRCVIVLQKIRQEMPLFRDSETPAQGMDMVVGHSGLVRYAP